MDPRKQRLLTGLVTGLLVLIGLNLWLEPSEIEEGPSEEWSKALPRIARSGVDQIALEGKGSPIVLKRDGGGWKMAPPSRLGIGGKLALPPTEIVADTRRIDQLLESVSRAEVGAPLDVEDLEPHGLKSPLRVVTLSGDGETLGRIEIGRKAPAGVGTYVRTQDQVHMTRQPLGAWVAADFEYFRTREIIQFARSALTRIEITGAEPSVGLTREGSGWWMDGDVRERASQAAVDGLLASMLDLRLVAYGAAAGTPMGERLIKISTPEVTQTLHVWQQGGSWWADSPLHQGPVEITPGLQRTLLSQPLAWRSRRALPVHGNSAVEIQLSIDGKQASARRDGPTWNDSWAMALMGGLGSIEVDRTADVPPPGTSSGSVALTDPQGKVERLTLHQAVPGGRVGVDVAGGRPFLVPSELVKLLQAAAGG